MSAALSMQSRGFLDVWLEGELLGQLHDRTLGYLAFDFDEATIERHGVGSLLLSLSLPVSWETVDPFVATPFFAGLLPEGAGRERLCGQFGVALEDNWGLLAVLGRESAGALVIVAAGEAPPDESDPGLQPLDEDELAAELDALGEAPLGVTVDDDEIRLSLAGVQDKLPLARTPEGQLALPLRGHPSTVIAKPSRQTERFPDLVANEAFCLTVATLTGLPTTDFSVEHVRGVPLLLVERFDRRTDDEGRTVRVHQEDACQATAILPSQKYEHHGGPSLARVAALIDEHSKQPGLDRLSLLRLTVLNTLLGNADAHGKNVSFLHTEDGVVLAPAYDLVSTQAYAHTDLLAMKIGAVERLRHVRRSDLIEQAAAIGIRERLANQVIDEVGEKLAGALDLAQTKAAKEGWESAVIERIVAGARERAALQLTR